MHCILVIDDDVALRTADQYLTSGRASIKTVHDGEGVSNGDSRRPCAGVLRHAAGHQRF